MGDVNASTTSATWRASAASKQAAYGCTAGIAMVPASFAGTASAHLPARLNGTARPLEHPT